MAALVATLCPRTVAVGCGLPRNVPRANSARTTARGWRQVAVDATLVMTEPLAREISVATIAPVEMAGVILARAVPHRAQIRLLAREVHWVPPSQYAHQSSHALSIRPEGYVHALAR